MNRVDSIMAKLFLMMLSVITALILIEALSNYYLWNIASEEQFNVLASISQVKERYGQDFFVEDNNGKDSVAFVAHQYLGYVPSPNFRSTDNYHSSLGFRGDDIEVPKPDGVYRIAAIGGSTTYGTAVKSPSQAYPYQLQEYLRAQGYENVEVVNAGVGAYTSWESLMNLQFRVLDIDPDLIIIYHAINDAHARVVYPYEAYRGDNSGYRAPIVQDTVIPKVWEYSTALRILGILMGWISPQNSLEWTRSRTASTNYRELYLSLMKNGTYPLGIFVDVPIEDMIANNPPIYFYRNMKSMALMAQGYGAEVMFTTFAYDPASNFPTVSDAPYIQMLEEHNAISKQVAEETQSYFYDFAPNMPMGKDYFKDGRHMTEEGNRIRAQLFGDFIIENILN